MANLAQQLVNGVKTRLGINRSGGGGNKGAVMRYPEQHPSGAPAILFTRHRAQYSAAATQGENVRSKSAASTMSGSAQGVIYEEVGQVAMYMPMGISIADNMVYDTAATGVLGALYARGGAAVRDLDASAVMETLTNPSEAMAKFGAQYSDFKDDVGGAGVKYGGLAVGAMLAKIGLGAAGVGGIVNTALNEEQKNIQSALNPREFLVFKAPSMRSFSLNFRFIPESETEAQTVDAIIKWFRTGMYPEITTLGFAYRFPDAFQISLVNVDGIPNIPETFLESVNVTFNQNSMSYYKSPNGGRPVEVNMALTFKEIQPLNRQLIEHGGY